MHNPEAARPSEQDHVALHDAVDRLPWEKWRQLKKMKFLHRKKSFWRYTFKPAVSHNSLFGHFVGKGQIFCKVRDRCYGKRK